ncbi:pyridoxamine 5'-phosphate oxidase family protein [bacterium RCC_150]
MNTSSAGPETQVLTVHECWKYLRSSSIGRVALVSGDTPEIFPVNYVPDDGTLIFRTGPGTKLNAALGGSTVAFEADGLNPYGTIAWSVVLKGSVEVVTASEDIRESIALGLSPWEGGTKDNLVRITPMELTGRRFVIAPPTRWWPPQDVPTTGREPSP